jgi:hypothetical protein
MEIIKYIALIGILIIVAVFMLTIIVINMCREGYEYVCKSKRKTK